MPPKKQLTEDVILNQAFALARTQGFETITARGLAKALGCSTQPIYQSFGDMEGLKTAVIRKAVEELTAFVARQRDAALPQELDTLIGYVRFAGQEKKLFQLIFTSGPAALGQALPAGSRMPFDENLLIYANGMIMMSAFQTLRRSPEEQKAMLMRAYALFQGGGAARPAEDTGKEAGI